MWTRAIAFVALAATAAQAQDINADPFADTPAGGKRHTASGFVCPARIGAFGRDAVGATDPDKRADFCAYSAQNGVYGTIKVLPLEGPYDARSSLARDFVEQEGEAARRIADGIIPIVAKPAPVTVYARTYETARLGDTRYRVLFSGAQFGNWAVEATIEYADPRDIAIEDQFFHAVFAAANTEIAGH